MDVQYAGKRVPTEMSMDMIRLPVVARATYTISSPSSVAREQASWTNAQTRSSNGWADDASRSDER